MEIEMKITTEELQRIISNQSKWCEQYTMQTKQKNDARNAYIRTAPWYSQKREYQTAYRLENGWTNSRRKSKYSPAVTQSQPRQPPPDCQPTVQEFLHTASIDQPMSPSPQHLQSSLLN